VNYHVRKGGIERVVQLADELTTYFDPERRGIRKLRSTASGRVCGLNPPCLYFTPIQICRLRSKAGAIIPGM
jgi:hypothetical protein